MSDDKVNMSLDEIIHRQKKEKKPNTRVVIAGRNKKQSAKGAVVRTFTRSPLKKRQNAPGAARAASNAQTKKLVQNLVNKALKRRLAASTRPLIRRGGVRAAPLAVRPAMARVNIRSRAIRQARAQPVQVVRRAAQAPVQIVRRARPAPIIYEEEYVEAQPRVIPARRPVVQRRIQRVQRPVVQQRVAQRVVRRQPRQQVVFEERPVQRQFVQRVRQVPRVQQRIIQRVRQPQVVREFVPRRQQNQQVQYVAARTAKNNNFRNALGLSNRREFAQGGRVQRFESSSSFIRPGQVVRRGRGFVEY